MAPAKESGLHVRQSELAIKGLCSSRGSAGGQDIQGAKGGRACRHVDHASSAHVAALMLLPCL